VREGHTPDAEEVEAVLPGDAAGVRGGVGAVGEGRPRQQRPPQGAGGVRGGASLAGGGLKSLVKIGKRTFSPLPDHGQQ